MKKEKLLSITYCVLCFAILWVLHASPCSLIKDTYGLCKGEYTIKYATDFFGLISLLYVNSVKYLFGKWVIHVDLTLFLNSLSSWQEW